MDWEFTFMGTTGEIAFDRPLSIGDCSWYFILFITSIYNYLGILCDPYLGLAKDKVVSIDSMIVLDL